MNRRHRIFAGLTVALSVAAAVAVCEAALRIFFPGPQVIVVRGNVRLSADPVLVYELLPGAYFGGDDVPISSAGLRDQEYAETKAADTFRIAVVGDSVAFGHEVRRRDALAKTLERLLNESRLGSASRYEVLNFAVHGYNSQQIARWVEVSVSRFSPDLVIYLYCLNDPEDLDKDVEQLVAALDPSERHSYESLVRHAGSALSRLRLYQRLMAIRDSWSGDQSRGLRIATYVNSPDYYAALHADGPRWDRVKGDLTRMGTTIRRLNARFIGVISPHLWAANDERRFRVEPPLTEVSSKVADAFRTAGASVIDLAPAVARFSQATGSFLGVDEVHLAVSGHRLAAVALLDLFLRKSMLPGVAARDVRSLALDDPELGRMIQALR